MIFKLPLMPCGLTEWTLCLASREVVTRVTRNTLLTGSTPRGRTHSCSGTEEGVSEQVGAKMSSRRGWWLERCSHQKKCYC